MTNNEKGIVGVNWDVSLVQLRITTGIVFKTTISRAWDWVLSNMNTDNRIPIVSLSISWGDDDSDIKSKIQDYTTAGGLLVCSTGNAPLNNDIEQNRLYPGFYGSELFGEGRIDNIITVGTIDVTNNRPIDSNWGADTIDIYAPGENILSTIPFEMCSSLDDFCSLRGEHTEYGYHCYSGSSMATPYVAAVAGLLLSVNPNLSAAELKECIINGADVITIMVGENNDTPQTVNKLNAWGAFKYLMKNYPIYHRSIEYIDDTYSYFVDGDASFMKDHTSMMKFDIQRSGSYTFTVSSNNSIEVKLYDSNLQEISITQTKSNENCKIEFSHNLLANTYYVRTNFINSSNEGTISVSVECPPHTHDFSEWASVSPTMHSKKCSECGSLEMETEVHVVKETTARFAPCLVCGYLVDLDKFMAQTPILKITQVTLNGSYILPNGIIVLVDEDIEANENGTLVFYDKDKLPVTQ